VLLGRSAESDVAMLWASEVSRLHAELHRLGAERLLVGDGLSSNGTFVSGERPSDARTEDYVSGKFG